VVVGQRLDRGGQLCESKQKIETHLCSDHTVEVGLHELLDKVDLIELVERRRLRDVEDGDDLRCPDQEQPHAVMVRQCTHVLVHTCLGEVLEQLELAEGAETEKRVLEGQDALDRDLPTRRLVDRGDYSAVRALAQRVADLVVGACADV
jgi:hypothetical protein